MRSRETIVFFVLVMFAQRTPVHAETGTPPKKLEVDRSHMIERLTGDVDSVQSESFFLRHAIQGGIATDEVTVTPDTRITIDGYDAQLTDLTTDHWARTIGIRGDTNCLIADIVDAQSRGQGNQDTRGLIPVLFAAGGGGGSTNGPGGTLIPPTWPCVELPCGITLPVLDCLGGSIIHLEVINEVLSCLPLLELELEQQENLATNLVIDVLGTANGELGLAIEILQTKLEHVCRLLENIEGEGTLDVKTGRTLLVQKLRRVKRSLAMLVAESGEIPGGLLQELCVDLRAASDAALQLASARESVSLDALHSIAISLRELAKSGEALIDLPRGEFISKKQEFAAALIGCVGPCDGLVTEVVSRVDSLKSAVAWKLRHLAEILQATFASNGAVDQLQLELTADLFECADGLELLSVTPEADLGGIKQFVSQKFADAVHKLKLVSWQSVDGIDDLRSLLANRLTSASDSILNPADAATTQLVSALADVECICRLLSVDLTQKLLNTKHGLLRQLIDKPGHLDADDLDLVSLLVRVDPDLDPKLRTDLSNALRLTGDLSAHARWGLWHIIGIDVDVNLLADARLCEILHSGGTLDTNLSLRLAELLRHRSIRDADFRLQLSTLFTRGDSPALTIDAQTWTDVVVALQANLKAGNEIRRLARSVKTDALSLSSSLTGKSTDLVQQKRRVVRHLRHAASLFDQLAGVLHAGHSGDPIDRARIHRIGTQIVSRLDATCVDCTMIGDLQGGKNVFALIAKELSLVKAVIADLSEAPAGSVDAILAKLNNLIELAESRAGFLVSQPKHAVDTSYEVLARKLELASGLNDLVATTAPKTLADLRTRLTAKLLKLAEQKRNIRKLRHLEGIRDFEIHENLTSRLKTHQLLCLDTAELCESIARLQRTSISGAEAMLGRKLRVASILLKHGLETKQNPTLGDEVDLLLYDCLPAIEQMIAELSFRVGDVKHELLQVLLYKTDELSLGSRVLATKYLLAQSELPAKERIARAVELLLTGNSAAVKQSLRKVVKGKLLSGKELKHALQKAFIDGCELDDDSRAIVVHLLLSGASLDLKDLKVVTDVIRHAGPLTDSLKVDLRQLVRNKVTKSLEHTDVLMRGFLHEAFAHHHVTGKARALLASTSPPARLTELVPQLRNTAEGTYTWISGYWHFNDLTGDFEWVSGLYRKTPPGRKWMPGFWKRGKNGHRRIPGAWVPEAFDISNAKIVKEIPSAPLSETVDLSKNNGKLRLSGEWLYKNGKPVWKKGRWTSGSKDWVWTPARQIVIDRGIVLLEGYWDHPFADRGLLFAPLRLKPGVTDGVVYHVAQTVMIPERIMMHLFSREGHQGYLFGDFYSDHDVVPWFKTLGHDHILAFEALSGSDVGVDFMTRLENWHDYFRSHSDSCPPRSLFGFATFFERNKDNPHALHSVLAVDATSLGVFGTQFIALDPSSDDSSDLEVLSLAQESIQDSDIHGASLTLTKISSLLNKSMVTTSGLLGGGVTGGITQTVGGFRSTLGGVTTGTVNGIQSTVGGATGALGGAAGGVGGAVGGALGGLGGGTGPIGGLLGGGVGL